MSSITLSVNDWNPTEVRYMQPKVNDKGGKSISVISKQTNRGLHIQTPLMTTWGISDYVNEKGESDGKFTMSLSFPNGEYATDDTNAFLEKMKGFEKQLMEDAAANSELWWGESLEIGVIKHTFFPFLKYPKDKVTGKPDITKSPTMRLKVPNYSGKWAVEIYNTEGDKIFPCDDQDMTPSDFVPSRSSVKNLIQCTGIWIGGKGWGLTWKLTQCMVKPPSNVSVFGKCQLTLSENEKTQIQQGVTKSSEEDETNEEAQEVEDTDDEVEPERPATPPPTPVKAPSAPKKKVVRKKAAA